MQVPRIGLFNLSLTGWYVSAPHWSHVYVATVIMGLTSVDLVTIPLTWTSLPMRLALMSRTERDFCCEGILKYSSLQKKKSKYQLVQYERPLSCWLISIFFTSPWVLLFSSVYRASKIENDTYFSGINEEFISLRGCK